MAILKDLIVHGSSRFLNKIYANEIQTPLIEAEAGIIKKLKADDATVVGLLDVQGQMHTNSWTNSNIATIDGSFYITPTLSSSSGTVSFSSATAATFTGTYSAVSSLYIGNNTASTVQWTSGSKILITGEVQVDEEWTPLGTLLGTLNSTNPTTSMPIVNITDNRNNTSNILTNIYSLKDSASLNYRNLKISLYQRADNSEYYPLGIFMTALGQNGKTFLDIYGGVNELTTSYGGYANPNVRIGNLSGLPAITTAAGNFTPVGWGIYTINGYFSGTIVSNTGVIGGWKLGASSLYNGTTGLNNTTAGIYLGTDGIRNYQDINTYVNITEGVIEAKGVNLTGTINATAGNIGGFQIDSSSIHTNNVAITSNVDNSIALSSADFTRTINNTSRTGLRLAIGDKFGVTGDGTIYASNVDLTGKITATSGTIGGIKIIDGNLDISSISIGMNQVTNLSTALEGKQAAGDYATNTALNNVSTTANTALSQSVWYAECSTTAGTAVKVATISPVTTNFVLTNGITVNVKFVNTNSVSGSSLQLNVNETGAKNIKYIYNGTYNNIQSNYLKANQMYQFRYDGTYWIVQMMYNTNDFDRSLYEVALQASEAIPSASIAVLGLDEKLHLLNSSSFRISCPLLYVGNAYSADNVTNSFSRATNYTYWGTPFNLTNTHSIQNATANTNVYVVGTLSGDIFTPNTTVLTCAEPTTEDGLYYMLLGRMTSTRYAILQAEHPIYIYKNGKFQKLEATTATSYITYIDANNGIKIHNESDTLNYLQLNSTAISIYRNNIETLNVNNNEVRIGKINGNNVFIDNTSVNIREGQSILASFGINGMQIGQNNKNRATINPLSFKLIDKEGNTYFHASDLRESQDDTVEIIDTFISDGSNEVFDTIDDGGFSTLKTYSLSFPATDTNYTVEISDSSGEGLTKTRSLISFTRNANEGAIITVTYETSSYLVKAYTLGFRLENSKIGALSCGIGDHITASGISSYAEGYRTIASGRNSHAEGVSTRASGDGSHAEGYQTTVNGWYSHAEGRETTANGWYSHAEGYQTTASIQFSHAEGYNSIASGGVSHAEGRETTASGNYSHAEGQGSIASGDISHAEGAGTIASSHYQHVQGKYNIKDLNNRYAFIIGNGRQEPNAIVRSNALTVDWNGNIEAAGDITANNLSINKIITGNYNIEDTNNQYAFIVGNGTSSDERSNSFTVDWNGSLTLTKPVYSGNFITCKDGNDTIKFKIGGDGGGEIGSNLIVKGNQVINGNLAIDGFMTVSSNTYSTIKYLNVGYLTVSTRKPFSIVQKTYTRTITANSACYISQKYTSPTGYIPIGIIDWGTFNGTHADYCIMGHAYIWRGNPNTIDIYVWNQHPSASATNVVIYVNILCIANTFL